jgi:hypothetical protein
MSSVVISVNPLRTAAADAVQTPKLEDVHLEEICELDLEERESQKQLCNCLLCFICSAILVGILLIIIYTRH